MKNRMKVLIGKLMTNERLWTYLTVDFITKLLLVAEKDAILVVYDWLSKMVYFIATTEGMLVKELTRLFKNNV